MYKTNVKREVFVKILFTEMMIKNVPGGFTRVY